MEIGTTYRLRTPKTGLGEGGGRGKRNLKANSFKRKSVDGYIIKLSEVILYQNVLIRDFVPHKIKVLCVNQDP